VPRKLVLLPLLVAACGGASKPPPKGRPEDVARAAFEALKAGNLAPLEAHLVTSEEQKKSTGVVLDDTTSRERWETLVLQHHERLNVDWETAASSVAKVKYDPMGVGANVTLSIKSSLGTIAVDVAVTKVGRRFVFDGVKPGPGAETKQASPDSEPESEEDGG
jgi:hypothetical protein